jgi:hypothetical protein
MRYYIRYNIAKIVLKATHLLLNIKVIKSVKKLINCFIEFTIASFL